MFILARFVISIPSSTPIFYTNDTIVKQYSPL